MQYTLILFFYFSLFYFYFYTQHFSLTFYLYKNTTFHQSLYDSCTLQLNSYTVVYILGVDRQIGFGINT
jgi:hypothetical protein